LIRVPVLLEETLPRGDANDTVASTVSASISTARMSRAYKWAEDQRLDRGWATLPI
jgi:hypothetical protein